MNKDIKTGMDWGYKFSFTYQGVATDISLPGDVNLEEFKQAIRTLMTAAGWHEFTIKELFTEEEEE